MDRPENPLNEVSDIPAFVRSLDPRLLMFRGILSVLFGILALLWPVPGLLTITILFGAYAFADGIFAFASGVQRSRQHRSFGFLIFEGLLGIAVGVLTVLWPGITLLALSVFIGFWAIATGILEILAAVRIPLVFPNASGTGRVLLAIAGVLSITLGVTIFLAPPIGAITLLTLVATYSLIFGVLMMIVSRRIHEARRRGESSRFPEAA